MDLRHIVAMVRTSALAIIVLAVLGVLVGVVATVATVPVYRAHATVMVSVVTGESANDLNLGATFVARQISTYAELAQSPKVLGPVVDDLGLSTSAAALSGSVSAKAQDNTALIDIYVKRTDPSKAADIANSIAKELAVAVAETSPVETNGRPAISVTEIAPATAPSTPYAPSSTTNVGSGLAIGLLLGLGWAVLRQSLDTKVRTEVDARGLTGAPVLGTISREGRGRRARSHRTAVAAARSQRSEEFRQLRTNLQFVDAGVRPRSFVITSTRSGEGRTSTAIDLAFALSQSGATVCLVDADLREPTIASALALTGETGLTSVLSGSVTLDEVLHTPDEPGPTVIASGPMPPNPSELLSSPEMEILIKELEDRFETVIFDCAPLLPVADSAILSKLTGGALVVVGSGVVTREELTESLTKLETIDGRLLGIVVNMVKNRSTASPAYH